MITPRPDLYAVLGVPPTAAQVQISRAYRALLRRHHPDTRVASDEADRAVSDATLQQVIAAYSVLHDPVRRADYDRQNAAAHPQPQRRLHDRPLRRPPIVAGPVRWHPTP